MPGIAGIIRKEPSVAMREDLNLMVDSMRHESYYTTNKYVDEDLGLYVGWTAHPGSLGACMPLVSRDKDKVLILVGEHFSHAHEPASRDGSQASHDCTQGLLSLYLESEDKFLKSLNGWFCGVAIDFRLRKATLFNDRYGMCRIYFHEGEEEFLFASEAKSLLRIRPALRAMDPPALAQYLRCSCVMGDRTLFKNVYLLPCGSAWSFFGGAGPQKRCYFDFADWEKQPTLSPDKFYPKFQATVSRVFPAYMDGPSSVAFSLTAGLDTRAILAVARRLKRSLPCYTFGGPWGDTYDIRTARRLSDICHQAFDVIKINEQFLQGFPDYARKSVYLSDGTHDTLGAHDVYFNEIARNIAPVRLTGKFGSEVVRIRKLIACGDFPRRLLRPEFIPFLDAAPLFRQISRKRHPLTRVVSEEIPWAEYGRAAVEQSKLVLRTPYMDNELVKLMYQAPPDLRASRDLQSRYVQQTNQEIARVPTNMGAIRYGNPLTSEVTYFLKRVLFKVEYIYLFVTPHSLTRLDRKLEKLRPERILAGRQKFEGYRIWMKTHFADFLRDTLLNPRAHCTDFFDRASLVRAVNRHVAGTHNYLNEINKALTVELIFSTLLAP